MSLDFWLVHLLFIGPRRHSCQMMDSKAWLTPKPWGPTLGLVESQEWLLGRRVRSSFELEGAQVEQLENQLRAKGGVAAKPSSGGTGVTGILAGAAGGDSGTTHAGDGRAGAGKSQGNDMLNNALGGSMAGQLALGAMKSGGGLLGLPGAKSGASAASGPAATAEGTEQAEVAQQLTGEGEDVATVADTAQQEEVDEQEMEEGEGPPEGDVEEMMGKDSHGTDGGHFANETLTELVQQLVRAKRECLSATVDCLPALKQVRYRVWPFVQTLIPVRSRPLEPTDFHPQVLKAKVTCGETNRSLIFQHTWKAAGWAIMENLRGISPSEQRAMEDNYRWCDQLADVDRAHSHVFTFVREPLARFMSGFAEIERHSDTAQLFLDRFFEDGIMYNGHVKPQSEFLAPFSTSCGLRMDFIGKIEDLSNDWSRFLASQQCFGSPFRTWLGQHPTEHRDTRQPAIAGPQETFAMSSIFGVKLYEVTAAETAMHSVLKSNDNVYLRAFCWLSLPLAGGLVQLQMSVWQICISTTAIVWRAGHGRRPFWQIKRCRKPGSSSSWRATGRVKHWRTRPPPCAACRRPRAIQSRKRGTFASHRAGSCRRHHCCPHAIRALCPSIRAASRVSLCSRQHHQACCARRDDGERKEPRHFSLRWREGCEESGTGREVLSPDTTESPSQVPVLNALEAEESTLSDACLLDDRIGLSSAVKKLAHELRKVSITRREHAVLRKEEMDVEEARRSAIATAPKTSNFEGRARGSSGQAQDVARPESERKTQDLRR
eukprot:s34_g36.t1